MNNNPTTDVPSVAGKRRGLPEPVRRFCALSVGCVFFISGILKLLDPVGAGLVVEEYFRFMHIAFLSFFSKPAGLLLALTETILGMALITGVWRRIIAIMTSALLAFFTLITIVLVIANPVMDCGCFGEAVHLTHTQSLIKNIVLCLLSCAAFIPLGSIGKPKKRKYVSFAIVGTAVIAFSVYSLLHIPMVDFTDFRPGARLAAVSESPDEAYGMVFTYEKDGLQKDFTLGELPDSTWTFVSARQSIEDAAESAPSLSIKDAGGEYLDEIAGYGKTLVISVYDIGRLNERRWAAVAEKINVAIDAGYSALLLVAASPEEYAEMAAEDGKTARALESFVYYSDYKTLITLNRSNGGVTCFHDGFLVRKFSSRKHLDGDDLSGDSVADSTELTVGVSTSGHLAFQAVLLYCFAVMLLL